MGTMTQAADHATPYGLEFALVARDHIGPIERDRIQTRAYKAKMALIERIYAQRAELIQQRHEVRCAKLKAVSAFERAALDRREKELDRRIDGLAVRS